MSKRQNDYRLVFSGLRDGEHMFDYVLDKGFMLEFPEEESFFDPEVEASLRIEKTERTMRLGFRFSGTLKTHCDRCLRELSCPVDIQEEILVKLIPGPGRPAESDDEKLWLVPEDSGSLDLSPYFHEVLVLARPIQAVCPPAADGSSGCDPDMERFLEEDAAVRTEGETDPRWQALAGLKDRMTD